MMGWRLSFKTVHLCTSISANFRELDQPPKSKRINFAERIIIIWYALITENKFNIRTLKNPITGFVNLIFPIVNIR